MAKRNFTKGYKVYNQLRQFEEKGDKKFLSKCMNAIMDYREVNKNTAEFDFNKAFKMLRNKNLDELYCYLNNWLAETDDDYDGENWYGETYQ